MLVTIEPTDESLGVSPVILPILLRMLLRPLWAEAEKVIIRIATAIKENFFIGVYFYELMILVFFNFAS